MALTKLVAGVLREIWEETTPLPGGSSRTIVTGITARSVVQSRTLAFLILANPVQTPLITGTITIVGQKLAIVITNNGAVTSSATYKLDVSLLQSTQQARDPAPGVVHILADSSTFGTVHQSLGVVAIGDSHTAGVMGTAVEALRNDVNSGGGNWDPNSVGNAGCTGSWTAYLESFLRQNTNKLGAVRVANLGSGGATAFTWSGIQAGMYFYFVGGQPAPGQTVSIGGVTYTFRNAFGVANDVVIGGTAQQTAHALGNVINGATGFGSLPNPLVFCANPADTLTLRVWARRTGLAGNTIPCASTAINIQTTDAGLNPITHLVGGAEVSTVTSVNFDMLDAGGFGSVDAIAITLGTNDAGGRAGYDAADFAYEAAKLVAYLHGRYPAAKIVWWLPPDTSVPARNAMLSSQIRPAILALQAANPTFFSAIDAYTIPVELTGLYLSADGMHLNNIGYNPHTVQNFAAALVSALQL